MYPFNIWFGSVRFACFSLLFSLFLLYLSFQPLLVYIHVLYIYDVCVSPIFFVFCRYVAKADALIKTAISACDNGPPVPPRELEADMEDEIKVHIASVVGLRLRNPSHPPHLPICLLF